MCSYGGYQGQATYDPQIKKSVCPKRENNGRNKKKMEFYGSAFMT